jgi:hypothetical protein
MAPGGSNRVFRFDTLRPNDSDFCYRQAEHHLNLALSEAAWVKDTKALTAP